MTQLHDDANMVCVKIIINRHTIVERERDIYMTPVDEILIIIHIVRNEKSLREFR